jgi:hypothetical protein
VTRAAAYARGSAADVDRRIERDVLPAMKRIAGIYGWLEPELFHDHDRSNVAPRPKLQELQRMVTAGAFQAVILGSLAQAFRSPRELAAGLRRWMDAGIQGGQVQGHPRRRPAGEKAPREWRIGGVRGPHDGPLEAHHLRHRARSQDERIAASQMDPKVAGFRSGRRYLTSPLDPWIYWRLTNESERVRKSVGRLQGPEGRG